MNESVAKKIAEILDEHPDAIPPYDNGWIMTAAMMLQSDADKAAIAGLSQDDIIRSVRAVLPRRRGGSTT
jgi:hypothetical protein